MRLPRRALRRWYESHGRHSLPWRLTRDTYAVLVSEVMLQQTQVTRVVPAYTRWLARWPTPASLAAESPAEVIRAWSGMGYNRRATNLWRSATIVVDRYDGNVPAERAELRTLPGVGRYTAAAVACFAGERKVAVVDTNVARVVVRAALGQADAKRVPAVTVEAAAAKLLPRTAHDARDHNLALMDIGALVCTAARPDCGGCPLISACLWNRAGRPAAPAGVTRTLAPFEATSRFARGRIVEALRERQSMDREAMLACLPPRHALLLDVYLRGLVEDGLVECHGGSTWSLPQGNSSMASPKL